MSRGFFAIARFALCFLMLLFFVSCESAEKGRAAASARPPEGFVQSRIDKDGLPHVALVVAPKRPGETPPDLSRVKGLNFLEHDNPEVRARLDPQRTPKTAGCVYYRTRTWSLLNPHQTLIYPAEDSFWMSNSEGFEDAHLYGSDYYILYDAIISEENHVLTFSHGDIKGKIATRRHAGALYVKFNDELVESRVFHAGGSNNPPGWKVSFVLPLQIFQSLDRETLERYVGEWTVTSTPEIPPVLEYDSYRVGGTPFSFDVRSFVIDGITGDYRPDIPIPDSEETHCGGATFHAKAQTLADGPGGIEGNLHWKAVILPPGGGEPIRTLFGESGAYAAGGTDIEIDWDGKSQSGQNVPGGKKYGVNISAVVTQNIPPQELRGRLWDSAFGPPEANVNPYEIRISPNPYIPYTEEELQYTYDADGYPAWWDDDGDGIPDRFPDHDGDGAPDFEPWQDPPGIHFLANPLRSGYNTTWTAEILSEEGAVLHTEQSPGTNSEVNFEWLPPADLEPQTLKLRVTATQCPRTTVDVGVLAQGTGGGGCQPISFEGEVAFGEKQGTLEFFETDNSELLASSEAAPPEVVAFDPTSSPYFGALTSGANAMARGSVNMGVPNNSFIQKIPGTRYGVIVAVSGVPNSEDLQEVEVEIWTTESSNAQRRNVTLYRGTHPKTGKRCFLRTIYLSESNSGGANPEFRIEPFHQSFSSLDATGTDGRLQDSERFVSIQKDLARRQMGESHDFPKTTTEYQHVTPLSVDAFRAAGYESLVANFKGEECWVRVRNQARVFYLSAHGYHDDNRIHFESGGEVYPTGDINDPSGLTEDDWANDKLDTVIMAACSVLDLGNWNKGQHSKTFYRKSPGFAWANITKPTTILLGYNAQAPDAEFGGTAVKRDTRILNLFYEQIARGNHPALAWLRANARMETRLGDNASAIYGNYYYFIKFNLKKSLFRPDRHVRREIWKIHLDYWSGDFNWETEVTESPKNFLLQTLPDQAEGEDHRAPF